MFQDVSAPEPDKYAKYDETGLVLTKNDWSDAIVPPPAVDPIYFAENQDYCGERLTEWQRIILKVLYCLELTQRERERLEWAAGEGYVPQDLLERHAILRSRGEEFEHLVMVAGRRSGKSWLSCMITAYEVYRMLLFDNPHSFYNVDSKTPMTFTMGSTKEAQAKDVLFKRVSALILQNPWFQGRQCVLRATGMSIYFQTLRDKRVQDKLKGSKIDSQPPYSVQLECAGCNSPGLRGGSRPVVVLSELAYYVDSDGDRSDDAVWEALEPATREYGRRRKMVSESTPDDESGLFYEQWLLANGLVPDDEQVTRELTQEAYLKVAGFKLPTWVMHHERFSREDFDTDFEKDPELAAAVWGAEFARAEGRYFDPQAVDEMFTLALGIKYHGEPGMVYVGHGDPGETRANFPLVAAHREGDNVIIDHIKTFHSKDSPTGSISFNEVQSYAIGMCERFRLQSLTFDQWESILLIENIRNEISKLGLHTKVEEVTANESLNKERYEVFKSALNQQRVKCYMDTEAKLELKQVRKVRGKPKPPTGGIVTTKDIVDCMAEVTRRLLSKPLVDKDELSRRFSGVRGQGGPPGQGGIKMPEAVIVPRNWDG